MRRFFNWLGCGSQVKSTVVSRRRPGRLRLELESLEQRELLCSYPTAPMYNPAPVLPPAPPAHVATQVVHHTTVQNQLTQMGTLDIGHTTGTDQLTHMGTLDIGHDPKISQTTHMGTLDLGHDPKISQLTHMGTLDLGHDPKISQTTPMGTLDIGHKATGPSTSGNAHTTKAQAPKAHRPARSVPIYYAPVETSHAAADTSAADSSHGAGVMLDDAPAPADPRTVARTNDFEVRVVRGVEVEFIVGAKAVTYAIREKLSDGYGETVHVTQIGVGGGLGAGFGVTGSSTWQEFQTTDPMSLNAFKGQFGSFVDGPSLSLGPIDTGELGDTRTVLHLGGKDGVTIPVDVSSKSIGANLVGGGFSYFY